MSSALAIFPRSSAAMVRAAFRIQKIIPVTKTTARIDIPPPKTSFCEPVVGEHADRSLTAGPLRSGLPQ